MNNSKLVKSWIESWWTLSLMTVALVCLLLSLPDYSTYTLKRECRQIQRTLNQMEKVAEHLMQEALDTPESEWIRMDDIPEDLVLYRYVNGELQSWANRFPINNDDINISGYEYQIHEMNAANRDNAPLAFITGREQYVNLGSGWYVMKTAVKGNVKIVAGILIKREFFSENEALKNHTNGKFGLSEMYDVVPLYEDDGNVVLSKNGIPLFSVVNTNPLSSNGTESALRWAALLLIMAALYSYHIKRRSFKSLAVVVIGLLLGILCSNWLIKESGNDIPFFSPAIFADSSGFASIGQLLLANFEVFLLISAIFINRKRIIRSIVKSGTLKRTAGISAALVFAVAVTAYIDITFRSLVLNSNINLELYKAGALSYWSVLVYLSYAILFLGLLFCINVINSLLRYGKRRAMFPVGSTILFLSVITVYSVLVVCINGYRKEFEENKVLTDKLSIDRDLPMEMRLVNIEDKIWNDQLIKTLLKMQGGEELIAARIADNYLWNIYPKYDLRVKVCGNGQLVMTRNYPYPVNCRSFFVDGIIKRFGIKIVPWSAFVYVNDYQRETKYLGMFGFDLPEGHYDLYVEIESNPHTEAVGYPILLTESGIYAEKEVKSECSYARYYENKLIFSKGGYDYPVYFDAASVPEGYSSEISNGYNHFFNKVSSQSLIIASRPVHSVAQYLMMWSYLFFFYALVIFPLLGIIKNRHAKWLDLFHFNTFRKKITVLLTASMVVALMAIGIGCVIYIIRLMDDNDRQQMKEKLQTVQSSLSDVCRYSDSREVETNPAMFNLIEPISSNIKAEINIYSSRGCLLRSTKPEVFDKYLLSSRMDPEAYRRIIRNQVIQFIHKETVGGTMFYSLYAPVQNVAGETVAIVNIPYFTDYSGYRTGDHSSIVAAVINVFLFLLLAAILGGVAMANSISHPLSFISRKMSEMDIYDNPEHINFQSDDELGKLISAYNKMVDDLDKSTKQLAQTERKEAWGEMARQIAHEIKNPLTPMKLSIQHLARMKQMNVPGWEEKFDVLAASLIEQIDILSNTASEFSSFAKFYNEENSEFDLVELLREQKMLFDTLDTVRMDFVFGVEPAMVSLKKSQITRAFVNLISNAIQALGGSRGGLVRVTLSRELDYYQIAVEDNGPGVSPENISNLFVPNFTTKSSGTGLGLTITRNIVEQSGGKIWYEGSELGGAAFIMKLPVKQ